MTLYAVKPRFQQALRPALQFAVRRSLSANALTRAAVVVSAVGGAILAFSGKEPRLLLVAVPVVAVRLALNALDGMLARQTGTASPTGELLNELGDRLGDLLLLGGLVMAGHADLRLGAAVLGVVALPAMVGVASRAAGGERRYDGPLSKPDRMVGLAAAAVLAQLVPPTTAVTLYLALLATGVPLTALLRYRRAFAQLRRGEADRV